MKSVPLVFALSVFLSLAVPAADLPIGPAVAHAQDDWRKTFNDICGKTQNAMAYSPKELRDFIADSDLLLIEIDRLREPERTIYLKRLQRCKGLFVYVLESKEKK
jgi:nitrate/nitrite-specific signal transduction histidine kinase